MSFRSQRELLDALLESTSSTKVAEILCELGDKTDLKLDEEFGRLGLQWHAFGDSESNISTINLATKPVRSLVERITNAMDALLEKASVKATSRPPSSREAAKEWFGRPVSAPMDGAFNWKHDKVNRDIAVVLQSSGSEIAPTIDVVDAGVGLSSGNFPGTILSLQEGNKINKLHLIGAFGQGGASTIAFSEYVMILSRCHDNPSDVSFTVIKRFETPDGWKEDLYAYLAVNVNGEISVPSCVVSQGPFSLYPESKVKVPQFEFGTCVRHFDFRMPGFTGALGPGTSNLYHALHVTMFDALLPFRAIDLRNPDSQKDELVGGTRNRLMKRAVDKKNGKEAKDNTELRHHREMEFIVPPGQSQPSIGLEYWVVLNYKPQKKKKVLRSHSNELYVNKNHPFVFTMNGQNQGELTARLLRELGLNMVSKHIVVHVDVSRAPKQVRSKLFSSDRESLKDDMMLNGILDYIRDTLKEDEELHIIERELTERLVNRETLATNEEVKRQVSKLLRDAGLEVDQPGPAFTGGNEETDSEGRWRQPVVNRKPKTPPVPILTKPFPQVTIFNVVQPKNDSGLLKIRHGETSAIAIETDADAEFDIRHMLKLEVMGGAAELAGETPLRGGRKRWRIRPLDNAMVGDTGQITVEILDSAGNQLMGEVVNYEVAPARERKVKKSTEKIPDFDITPISPDEVPEVWEELGWSDLAEEEQLKVAYKPVSSGSKTVIYYSTVFTPFKNQENKLKSKSQALSRSFRQNYEIWIGYHAILQMQAENSTSLTGDDDEKIEKLLEEERSRVARVQIRQAKMVSEMMLKLAKEPEYADV
ncbi:hypothetical protein N9V88_00360 [bacterium]|nr:hypothetical protein [bacterium]